MATPNANAALSGGWAGLGSTIAGGNKLNGELLYDQGEALGARTQDALAQARERIDKNQAMENLDSQLAGIIPDPKLRAAIVGSRQAGFDPTEVFNAQKVNQEVQGRTRIMDPTTSDSDVARTALALGQNAKIIEPIGEFQSTNVLHPDQGVQATDLGTQLAGAKLENQQATTAAAQAAAAKNRDEVAHPDHYRIIAQPAAPGSDGSQPVQQETYAQLVAQGLAPMPTPGRALIQMGGEDFTRRVNYIAGQGKNGATPPPVAAPPGVTPPAAVVPPGVTPPAVVPPGTTPAAAPAAATPGVDTSGIKLPEQPKSPPGFQANFDAAAFGQHKSVLNDLSRKSGTGGNDDALNRVAGHLDVFEQLLKNSGNTNFVAGNQLKNWFQQEMGQPYPNNAALAAHILGTEIVRSMTSIGAGTGDERGGIAKDFSNASSLPMAAGAIDTTQRLLREQATGINQRVSASGVKDYYAKYLTPTARRRMSLGEFDPANASGGGNTPNAAPRAFNSEAEAEAAKLAPGTKVIIGGVAGTWQ